MSDRKRETAVFAIPNRAKGLCGCGAVPPPGELSCDRCVENGRARAYARRKLPGHCSRCGVPVEGEGRCSNCRKGEGARKNRLRQERRAAGLCVRCAKPPETPGASLCDAHKAISRRSSNAYGFARRQDPERREKYNARSRELRKLSR